MVMDVQFRIETEDQAGRRELASFADLRWITVESEQHYPV
jgi:hypothetical protein